MNPEMMLCQECVEQDKNKRKKTHKNLIMTKDTIGINCAMGSVNETYYRCEICGREWMHETGNLGYGWILSKP